MRATRKVTVEAKDMKAGMTALEILGVMAQVPHDLVPKVEIGLNGRIKRIKTEIEFDPGI
jgi:hypothetical protein